MASPPDLGSVLVIGGCGFFGSHLVRHLKDLPGCGPIYVMSRDPKHNRVEGVEYCAVDITNKDEVRKLLEDKKPRVIFQAAASRATDLSIPPNEHHNTIVNGTKNVMDIALEVPETQALIYTSTCSVSAGYQHYDIDENQPLWTEKSNTLPYLKAKAVADALVRATNTPQSTEGKLLLTCTLRMPMVYGERDTQYVPAQLNALKNGQTKVQLGNGRNKVQPTYAGNCATAHILAAQALVSSVTSPRSPEDRVDGEAFHIHDGEPQPFWDFSRRTWRHAGDKTEEKDVTIIPAWVALGMVRFISGLFMITTLGMKKPPLAMSRLYIQVTLYNATYSMEKARKRLGYNPIDDHDTHLKQSIEWEIENNPDKWPGMKAV